MPLHRDTEDDGVAFITRLKSGEYRALLLDDTFLTHAAMYDPECRLYTVGPVFETFSLAMGYPPDFDDEAIKAWSRCGAALCTHQPRVYPTWVPSAMGHCSSLSAILAGYLWRGTRALYCLVSACTVCEAASKPYHTVINIITGWGSKTPFDSILYWLLPMPSAHQFSAAWACPFAGPSLCSSSSRACWISWRPPSSGVVSMQHAATPTYREVTLLRQRMLW